MVTTRTKKRVNYTNVAKGIDDFFLIMAVKVHQNVVVVRNRQKVVKNSSSNSKKSIPQDSIANSPPPPPSIPRSVIYRIHANFTLKPSVTPLEVQYEDFEMFGSENSIKWRKLRRFTDGALTSDGIYEVVDDVIEGKSQILQNGEWDSKKDAIYYCKNKRSSTADVLKTKNK